MTTENLITAYPCSFCLHLINKVFITVNTALIEFYFKTEHQTIVRQGSITDALLRDAKGRVGAIVEDKVDPTDDYAVLETSGCNHGPTLSVHFYIQRPSLSLRMRQNMLRQNIITIA